MSSKKKLTLSLLLFALFAAAATVLVWAATVTSREVTVDSKNAGEVLIDDKVVMRFLQPAEGNSPSVEAQNAAQKLSQLLASSYDWQQFKVKAVSNGQGVFGNDQLLAVATPDDGQAAGASNLTLAQDWRDGIVLALGGTPPLRGNAESAYYPLWEGAKTKWVPILDVSNNGLRVGAAQVAGPEVQVDKCKAVALLGLQFKGVARIKAYIPISDYNILKLDRVQGVSVWATGDLKIVNF